MRKQLTAVAGTLVLAASVGLTSTSAVASGEIGDHVEDLKGHLSTYEGDVSRFTDRLDDMTSAYADQGPKAVETDQLIELWEEVKLHAAVEVTYVPVYASIWQGIYGYKEAVDNDSGIERVRAEQAALEAALWQGLGAVKMASRHQASGDSGDQEGESAEGDPIDRIINNLEKVTVEHAEGESEEATELVHDTYMEIFEGIEGALIEQDAELVESLEKDFNVTLPQQLEKGAPVSEVTDQVDAMKEKLTRAQELLEKAEESQGDVF